MNQQLTLTELKLKFWTQSSQAFRRRVEARKKRDEECVDVKK